MADAKIEIRVGAVSFSGEGDGKWLSEQLDKLLEKLPELAKVAPAHAEHGGKATAPATPATQKLPGTLASFLKGKNATTNQVRKFLATAVWLHDHDAKDRLTTKEVTKGLSDGKQSGLTNPSQCLASNVGQGFCQKDGKKQFFVTDEGRADLGV